MQLRKDEVAVDVEPKKEERGRSPLPASRIVEGCNDFNQRKTLRLVSKDQVLVLVEGSDELDQVIERLKALTERAEKLEGPKRLSVFYTKSDSVRRPAVVDEDVEVSLVFEG
jgi:5-deoxy-D-glucuronate isomerase